MWVDRGSPDSHQLAKKVKISTWTRVVAQTYNIAKTFVIFIDMFGGLLIFIYCYCLKFVVSVLPQKLFGGF